jgi:hypothetical protein
MINYNKLSDKQKEVLTTLLDKIGRTAGDFKLEADDMYLLRGNDLVYCCGWRNCFPLWSLTDEGKRIAMLLVDGKCIKNENK